MKKYSDIAEFLFIISLIIITSCGSSHNFKPVWPDFPAFAEIQEKPVTRANRKALSDNYANIAIQMQKTLKNEGNKEKEIPLYKAKLIYNSSKKIDDSQNASNDILALNPDIKCVDASQYGKIKIESSSTTLSPSLKNARVSLLEQRLALRDTEYAHHLNTDYLQLEKIPGGIPLVIFPRLTFPAFIESKKEGDQEVWYIPVILQIPNSKKISDPKELSEKFTFCLEKKMAEESGKNIEIELDIVEDTIFEFSFQQQEQILSILNSFQILREFKQKNWLYRSFFQEGFLYNHKCRPLSFFEFIPNILPLPWIPFDDVDKSSYYSVVLKTSSKKQEILKNGNFYNLTVWIDEDTKNDIEKNSIFRFIPGKNKPSLPHFKAKEYANFYYYRWEKIGKGQILHKLQVNPVYLESSEESNLANDKEDSFSFIVAADFQYHDSLTCVKKFFDIVQHPEIFLSAKAKKTKNAIKSAKFIVLAGDLVDCAGFSSNWTEPLIRGVGISAAKSPYPNEYGNLLYYLSTIPKPIFAIPGNHDVYAGTGGFFPGVPVLENIDIQIPFGRIAGGRRPIQFFYWLLSAMHIASPDDWMKMAFGNNYLYDGNCFWRKMFGPEEFCFTYKGHTFLGINTHELERGERFGSGPLVKHHGGGVQLDTILWMESMLKYYQNKYPGKRQFLFMHSDPRGVTPEDKIFKETRIGIYHGVGENFWGNIGAVTGLSAHENGAWLPVVTPVSMAIWNEMSAHFHQEWMQKRCGTELCNAYRRDADCYNARHLLEAIVAQSWTLDKGGLSHIFLGHDDVPYGHDLPKDRYTYQNPGKYNNERSIIPDKNTISTESFAEKAKFKKALENTVCKLWLNPSQPEWHKSETLKLKKKQELSFVRVDDVGQGSSQHGFCLVTVSLKNLNNNSDEQYPVTVEYIPLSQ